VRSTMRSPVTPRMRGETLVGELTEQRSAIEHPELELLEPRGIADDVDSLDLPALYREGEHPEQPPARGEHRAHRAVHQRGPREPGAARVRNCLLCPRLCASDLGRRAAAGGARIGPDHYVRVEHRDEPRDVAGAQSGEERANDFSLLAEIGVRNG